jgi:hypothetical protein
MNEITAGRLERLPDNNGKVVKRESREAFWAGQRARI